MYLNAAHKIASFFGGTEGNFETDVVLPLAQWTHVAITVENTASGRGNATTYVNGVAKKTGNVAIDSSTDKMIIGRHKNTPSKYFKGNIDELRVYNLCLTPQQLYSEYYYSYPPSFAKVDDVKLTSCRGGELPSLPEKVKVTLDNGMVNYVSVTWNNDFVPGDLESAGIKTRTGTFDFGGEKHDVTASMTVYEIAGSLTEVITPVGVKPFMPLSVTVTDGETESSARVIWAAVEESKYALIGNYNVSGYLPSVPGVKVTQKVTVKAVGEKTALQSQLSAFENKSENNYTAKSWAAYKAEIDNGKFLLEMYKPFAETLSATLSKITAADAALVNIKALRDYYEAHKEKIADDFTKESFAIYWEKLTVAAAVLSNADATQSMVNSAKAEMEAAVDALKATEKSKGCGAVSGAETTVWAGIGLLLTASVLLLLKRKFKNA